MLNKSAANSPWTGLCIILFFYSIVPAWTSSSWLILLLVLSGCFTTTNSVPTVCCHSNFAGNCCDSGKTLTVIYSKAHKNREVVIFCFSECHHDNDSMYSNYFEPLIAVWISSLTQFWFTETVTTLLCCPAKLHCIQRVVTDNGNFFPSYTWILSTQNAEKEQRRAVLNVSLMEKLVC